MSLDDIWAEPIVEFPAGPSNPEGSLASGPSHPALFLSDSEDEDARNVRRPSRHASASSQPQPVASPARNSSRDRLQGPEKSQLDVMFAGLDDDDDLFGDVAPPIDVESLKRQADAQVAAARSALPSTSTSGPASRNGSSAARDKENDMGLKTRRVVPKIDAERLLGPDGFPRLLKEYKTFKVTGKGHESADLEKLFRIYHAWTHKMFPKFQFSDTVERVERLCRSRRMAVNLKVWRDEAHGVAPEVRHEVTRGNDGSGSDSEENDGGNEDTPNVAVNHSASAPGPSSPASSRPGTPVTRPGSAASSTSSVPSSATDIDMGMDMDMDAMLREEEELIRAMHGAVSGKGRILYKPANPEDDDESLWAETGGIEPPTAAPGVTAQPGLMGQISRGEADDEDMWDIFDEVGGKRPPNDGGNNAAQTLATVHGEPVASPVPEPQPTIGADWDDMYE